MFADRRSPVVAVVDRPRTGRKLRSSIFNHSNVLREEILQTVGYSAVLSALATDSTDATIAISFNAHAAILTAGCPA